MATDASTMDLDSQHNCVTCKTRMSSLLHDSYKICCPCRGFECCLDRRCTECEDWSEEVMLKYIKYRKSLDSKSKVRKEKKTSSSTKLRIHPLGTLMLVFPPQLRLGYRKLGSLNLLALS